MPNARRPSVHSFWSRSRAYSWMHCGEEEFHGLSMGNICVLLNLFVGCHFPSTPTFCLVLELGYLLSAKNLIKVGISSWCFVHPFLHFLRILQLNYGQPTAGQTRADIKCVNLLQRWCGWWWCCYCTTLSLLPCSALSLSVVVALMVHNGTLRKLIY